MTIQDTQLYSDNHYSTSDTALSAWLYSQGFLLVDILNESFPSIFIFEKSGDLESYVRLWQTGKAEGNCCSYENARRKLLHIVKTGVPYIRSGQ